MVSSFFILVSGICLYLCIIYIIYEVIHVIGTRLARHTTITVILTYSPYAII